MLKFSPEMHLSIPNESRLITKIPKGHIRAHQDSCQGPLSLNYTKGAADTDGEGIERLWAWLNKLAASAKEMTPGGRFELLDDFCGYSNFRKMVGLNDLLLRRLVEALKQAMVHREEYVAFDLRLRDNDAAEVARWEHMFDAWNADHSLVCPFIPSRKGMFYPCLPWNAK